ncbi:MAG: hypothetical protein LWY06_05085 [Firmicutes bacterium]|nr:hypothetical protein [Bacillota bacterium]
MFKILSRSCKKCSGRLTDEMKLDLPGEMEIVCINCGNRFWESSAAEKYYSNREIRDCFLEDEHRQILKHQSPKSKSRREAYKRRLPGLSSVWLQV